MNKFLLAASLILVAVLGLVWGALLSHNGVIIPPEPKIVEVTHTTHHETTIERQPIIHNNTTHVHETDDGGVVECKDECDEHEEPTTPVAPVPVLPDTGGQTLDRQRSGEVSAELTRTGGPGSDFVGGTLGNDRLYGRGGRDHLKGYTGNDYLNGGPGIDLCNGDEGRDTYVRCNNRRF